MNALNPSKYVFTEDIMKTNVQAVTLALNFDTVSFT